MKAKRTGKKDLDQIGGGSNGLNNQSEGKRKVAPAEGEVNSQLLYVSRSEICGENRPFGF